MLRRRTIDAPTTTPALEAIERTARVERLLVEDLLDISRIITGRMHLDVRPVELAPVIEAAIEAVSPAAEARSVRLETALDPQASFVLGDAERLQQVAWNLLSNAIKFTPEGGRVDVRVAQRGAHVELTPAGGSRRICCRTSSSVRAPGHVEHRFRRKPNTHSDASRTLIPTQAEHRFRAARTA